MKSPFNEFAFGLYDYFRELIPNYEQPASSLQFALGRSFVNQNGLIKQEFIYQRRQGEVYDVFSAQFSIPESTSETELLDMFDLLEEQPAQLNLEHEVLVATLRSEGKLYGTTLGWFVIVERDDRICALKIEKHQILDILYLETSRSSPTRISCLTLKEDKRSQSSFVAAADLGGRFHLWFLACHLSYKKGSNDMLSPISSSIIMPEASSIRCLTLSEEWVLGFSPLGKVTAWNAASEGNDGKCLTLRLRRTDFTSCDFHPLNSDLFCVGTGGGVCLVWSISALLSGQDRPLQKYFVLQNNPLHVVQFSGDGKILLVTGDQSITLIEHGITNVKEFPTKGRVIFQKKISSKEKLGKIVWMRTRDRTIFNVMKGTNERFQVWSPESILLSTK